MKIRFTLLACSLVLVVVSTMPARAQAPVPHLSDDQKVLNEMLRLDKEERFAFRDQRLAHIEAQASRIDGLTLTYEKRDNQNPVFGSLPVFHMRNNTDISLGYILTWQMSTGSQPMMEYSLPGVLKAFEKQEHEAILADPVEGWSILYGSIQITWWAHHWNFEGTWNRALQGDERRTDETSQVPPPISSGAIYLSETADPGILRRSGGAGGRAVQAGFAQAEQWERDAPQREAAARAEEVRRAEESRQHEEWLRKREEKQARRASGGDGWATFINVLGAVAGAALEVQAQQAAAEGEASADAEDSEGNCGPYGPGTCQ
jgi:hypothetical protein